MTTTRAPSAHPIFRKLIVIAAVFLFGVGLVIPGALFVAGAQDQPTLPAGSLDAFRGAVPTIGVLVSIPGDGVHVTLKRWFNQPGLNVEVLPITPSGEVDPEARLRSWSSNIRGKESESALARLRSAKPM